MIDLSPTDWLRELLASQPEVKSIDYGTDAERNHLVLHTAGGRRLRVGIGDYPIFMGANK